MTKRPRQPFSPRTDPVGKSPGHFGKGVLGQAAGRRSLYNSALLYLESQLQEFLGVLYSELQNEKHFED